MYSWFCLSFCLLPLITVFVLRKLTQIVPNTILNVFTKAIDEKFDTLRRNTKIKQKWEIWRKYQPKIILKYVSIWLIFQHFFLILQILSVFSSIAVVKVFLKNAFGTLWVAFPSGETFILGNEQNDRQKWAYELGTGEQIWKLRSRALSDN